MCCVRERLPGGLLASLRVSLEPSRTMLSMPGAPLCGRGCLGCLPILCITHTLQLWRHVVVIWCQHRPLSNMEKCVPLLSVVARLGLGERVIRQHQHYARGPKNAQNNSTGTSIDSYYSIDGVSVRYVRFIQEQRSIVKVSVVNAAPCLAVPAGAPDYAPADWCRPRSGAAAGCDAPPLTADRIPAWMGLCDGMCCRRRLQVPPTTQHQKLLEAPRTSRTPSPCCCRRAPCLCIHELCVGGGFGRVGGGSNLLRKV